MQRDEFIKWVQEIGELGSTKRRRRRSGQPSRHLNSGSRATSRGTSPSNSPKTSPRRYKAKASRKTSRSRSSIGGPLRSRASSRLRPSALPGSWPWSCKRPPPPTRSTTSATNSRTSKQHQQRSSVKTHALLNSTAPASPQELRLPRALPTRRRRERWHLRRRGAKLSPHRGAPPPSAPSS